MTLIDIEKLPNWEFVVDTSLGDQNLGLRRMRVAFWEDIEKQPVVEAQPVGRAHRVDARMDGLRCNHCDYTIDDYYAMDMKYCPGCGYLISEEEEGE